MEDVPDAIVAGNGVVGEDVSDAKPVGNEHNGGFSDIPPNLSAGAQVEPMDTDKLEEEFRYNVNFPKVGMALIINNRQFEGQMGLGERHGTDLDAAKLYGMLKHRGFDVLPIQNNLTSAMVVREVKNLGQQDHSQCAMLVVCVLSHGDRDIVYGTDEVCVPIDHVTAPFKGVSCPTLVGKPKLFFIQACRGVRLDGGVTIQTDSVEADSDSVVTLPQEADVLLAFSTVPGYFAWRNTSRGSWFVQALVEVVNRYGDKLDLQKMLTRVNNKVATEFESFCPSTPGMHAKKQMPSVVSMLTRELYFPPST